MHELNLKLLQDLQALADTGSLYKAAERRHITHPAFGRRIRALEEWAGTPLVERSHQSTTLTAAGKTLLASAHEVLGILEQTHGLLQRPRHARDETITIAAGRTLSHTVLPGTITALNQAMPQLCWKVVTTSLDYGVEMLLQGKVDLLMCHAQPAIEGSLQGHHLAWLPVGQDTLIPVSIPLVPQLPKYALPAPGGGPLVPYLDYAQSMSLGKILRSHIQALCDTTRLRTVYEADLADSLHAMVHQGLGLAWLPLTLVKADLAQGRLARAAGPDKDVPINVRLYRRPAGQSKPLTRRVWAGLENLYGRSRKS
ncbi:LysR family transcriptional regulator [Delftia tsuruhatensis]|uniref:LysR family transcriptional regulator n=1 Tax=Delftia tsuruhatensis TaxID=180282 RepID=UPI001F360256|nr:LysR family transcriptional regulator [Delftia tsuruhatensis]